MRRDVNPDLSAGHPPSLLEKVDMATHYQRLDILHAQLHLGYTLTSGQAFRCRFDAEGFWNTPVQGQIIRIKEDGDGFLWQTYPKPNNLDLIEQYFRLDYDIEAAYTAISEADPTVAELVERYRGLRFLRQDPEEALLSFVCSAANSIPRIMYSVELLSEKFGAFIDEIAGRRFFSFPKAEILASADPDEIASAGSLGFRGANINKVASQLISKDQEWLLSLREVDHKTARAELMSLYGIGPKIADCVCLFALDKDEAVPVDTHVRQIAARLFFPDMTAKTVTQAVYDRVTAVFQEKFGPYAGLAQQFLFFGDIHRAAKG